jgi:hypothetical protein
VVITPAQLGYLLEGKHRDRRPIDVSRAFECRAHPSHLL